MAPSKKKAAKKAVKAVAKKVAPKAKAVARKAAPKPKKIAAKAGAGKKAGAAKAVKSAAKNVVAKVKTAAKTASTKAKTAVAKKTKTPSLATVAKTVAAVVAPAVLTTLAVKSATKKKSKSYVELMTPLDDRILVETEPPSAATSGGIIIPGTVDEKPQRGRVVAVGRGRRNKKGKLRPLEVNVGETVMFAESAGSKITVDGDELLIIREDEVLGVVG